MEKTGEMNLYLYVDGRGRMTMPSALRCCLSVDESAGMTLVSSSSQLPHMGI